MQDTRRFAETRSVSDYLNGRTTTAAFNAALADGGEIHVPAGEWVVERTDPLGSYAAALIFTTSNTRLVIDPDATIKLAGGQDCAVIRTARFATGEVPARLSNIAIVGGGTIDGNWANQTWLGPDGTAGGTVLDGRNDQNGVDFIETDGCHFDAHIVNCAQDGLSFASCTAITIAETASAKQCGKGCVAFFLCENPTIPGGVWEEPNDSPDNGVTKPYYTLSSSGYAAATISYIPNAAWSSGRNRFSIGFPKIKISNGQGRALLIVNALDGDIIAPAIEMVGNREAFSIIVQNDGVLGDTENINWIGGSIKRTGQTANARIGTISSAAGDGLYTRNVSLNGVKIETDGAFWSSIVAIDLQGDFVLQDVKLKHGGATTAATVDIRGCSTVKVLGGSMSGTISFNTSTTTKAVVSGVTLESAIIGRANVTTLSP